MFNSDQFDNAINSGRYLEAVDESLKAGADDDKEELRDRLFGKERIFEKALIQAVAENSNWLNRLHRQINQNIPDWWISPNLWGTINDPKYDYYKEYRSRFIKTQIKSAWIVAREEEIHIASVVNDIDFPLGMLYDLVHIFGSTKLHPLNGIHKIKVPILLVDENKEGYVASLFLEQVDSEGIDSLPYPHPIKMSGIPIDKPFEKAVENAFHFLRYHLKQKMPVFRWWVMPLSATKQINGIQGSSIYGAFIVGMYGSIHHLSIPEHLTTTCSGDISGNLISINGLAHKFQAASKENLQIVISKQQIFEDEDNLITDEQKTHLLTAETAEKLIEHFFAHHKISAPKNIATETPMISTPVQTQAPTDSPIGAIKTFFEVTDFKSFIYTLFAVIAGIAGLGILLVLLTYEPLIEAIKTSTQLESEQMTFLYMSIIVSVFFIAILAIYTRIIQPMHPSGMAPPFRNVLSFIILVVIILTSIGSAIYWWQDKPTTSPPVTIVVTPSQSKNAWYLKAKEALQTYDNKLVALEYINKGIEETQTDTLEHTMLLVFKMTLLLLTGDTNLAKSEAEQNYGHSPILDKWIDCLRTKQFFSSLIITETELKTQCPSPYQSFFFL